MIFENSQITTEELPKAKDIHLVPIQSRYLKVIIYNHFLSAFIFAAIAVFILFINENLRTPMIISGIIIGISILIGLSYTLTYLSFKNRAYAVREHDVIYQTGWLNKSLTIYPFSRIQYCGTESNVFERSLDLHRLAIYTAGGDGADVMIKGLELETAEKIKAYILDKIKDQDAEAKS